MPGAIVSNNLTYRDSPEIKEIQAQVSEVSKFVSKGFVKEFMSPYAVSDLLVLMKDDSFHVCSINNITLGYHYSFPRIIHLLHGSYVFSRTDLKSGYHQIYMKGCKEWKSDFRTKYDLYEQLILPFSLIIVPSLLLHLLDHVVHSFIRKIVFVRFDDMFIYQKMHDQHMLPFGRIFAVLHHNHMSHYVAIGFYAFWYSQHHILHEFIRHFANCAIHDVFVYSKSHEDHSCHLESVIPSFCVVHLHNHTLKVFIHHSCQSIYIIVILVYNILHVDHLFNIGSVISILLQLGNVSYVLHYLVCLFSVLHIGILVSDSKLCNFHSHTIRNFKTWKVCLSLFDIIYDRIQRSSTHISPFDIVFRFPLLTSLDLWLLALRGIVSAVEITTRWIWEIHKERFSLSPKESGLFQIDKGTVFQQDHPNSRANSFQPGEDDAIQPRPITEHDKSFHTLKQIKNNASQLNLKGKGNVSPVFINTDFVPYVFSDSRTNPFQPGGNDAIRGRDLIEEAEDELDIDEGFQNDEAILFGGPISKGILPFLLFPKFPSRIRWSDFGSVFRHIRLVFCQNAKQ